MADGSTDRTAGRTRVGIAQLEEVFREAAEFDKDPSAFDLEDLQRNLVGVLDDFKNLRGNETLLAEMDAKLLELVERVDFQRPGLSPIVAYFLTTLFENYANEGRGHRKAYDYCLSKRQTSQLDGVFIYEELTPAIFDEAALHEADALRYYLVGEVARFLEEKDPGGHWKDDIPLEKVKEASLPELLLELERRRARYSSVPNLALKAHTLEQRLAEAGFFAEAAGVRRVLAYFFERNGYIEKESFWKRLWKALLKLRRGRATFGRLSRWRMAFRLQILYMLIAVGLLVGTIAYWHHRQAWQLEQLNEYCETICRISH